MIARKLSSQNLAALLMAFGLAAGVGRADTFTFLNGLTVSGANGTGSASNPNTGSQAAWQSNGTSASFAGTNPSTGRSAAAWYSQGYGRGHFQGPSAQGTATVTPSSVSGHGSGKYGGKAAFAITPYGAVVGAVGPCGGGFYYGISGSGEASGSVAGNPECQEQVASEVQATAAARRAARR